MKKGEFLNISKRMVKEYFDRYVRKGNVQTIKVSEVEVIGYDEDDNNYRAILITPGSDELYYGTTYYKETGKIHSYIYKKVGKRVNGKKSRVSRYYTDNI